MHVILPGELIDGIIDHLHSDFQALGKCGMVHSKWLSRSRYHLFSTVQLWPWRVKSFFDLIQSNFCTFSSYIRRIEIDNSRHTPHNKHVDHQQSFFQIMSSESSSYLQVEAIQIRSFDWTTLSLSEQQQLRKSLAQFKNLHRLELLNVVFHDLREFARVISSFPLLQHLSLHVNFSKYLDLIIGSANEFNLPPGISSVELGTEDSNAVFLPLLLPGGASPLALHSLALKNGQMHNLSLVRDVLTSHASTMEHLNIDWKCYVFSAEEFAQNHGLGNLKDLKNLLSLHFYNILLDAKLLSLFAESLPMFSQLESHYPHLQDVKLGISLDSSVYSKLQSLLRSTTASKSISTNAYCFRVTVILDSSALSCWKFDQTEVEMLLKNLVCSHNGQTTLSFVYT